MKQENIKKRQNEPFFLNCQFAAKHYFNAAETLNYLVWFFCILSAVTILIPGTSNWIVIGVPLLFDSLAFFSEILFERSVSTAAKLRNFFDVKVLEINTYDYTESEVREIREIVEKTVEKHPEKHSIQIKNSGRDTPPGVLDWYEFSQEFSDDEVQYECQRQNCWWNKKMSIKRLFLFAITFFASIFILFTIFICFDITHELLQITLCSGIVLKIIERLIQHFKCHLVFTKIQGVCEVFEDNVTPNNIKALQRLIEERREIPVLEVNAIHKRITAKLSSHYKKITQVK